MSAVVITIGYQQLLLPNDKGVATVMKVLAAAAPCRYREYEQCVTLEEPEAGDRGISLTYLPARTRIEGAVKVAPVRLRNPRRLALDHETGGDL